MNHDCVVATHPGSELLLYSKEANQEGVPEFKLAKKVAIPEAADEVLLLGWPAHNDEPAELLAIADDYKKAKFNDWLVINHSDQAVTMRYGKDNDLIKLESGEAKTYRVIGEQDKGGEVIAEAMMKGEMKKDLLNLLGGIRQAALSGVVHQQGRSGQGAQDY